MTIRPSDHSRDSPTGSVEIPGFAILDVLSRTEDSIFFLANQISLDRQVTIRCYSEEAGADPSFQVAVTEMAGAMARLSHPGLVTIYNSGFHRGTLYIVMEHIPGKSLEEMLGGESITPEKAASVCVRICEALAHAHENNICHAELEPAQILLNPEAAPVIGNFKSHDLERYVATDIRAIGKILYRMLTACPFTEQSVHLSKIAGVPTQLAEIWDRCMNRTHPDAFQKIRDLGDALRQMTRSKDSDPARSGKNQVLLAKSHPAKLPTYPGNSIALPRPRGTTVLKAACNPVASAETTVLAAEPAAPVSSSSGKPLQIPPPGERIPPPTSATMTQSRSKNPLARNLVIICILLVAIYYVLEARKRKAAEIIQQQTQSEEPVVIVKDRKPKPEPRPNPSAKQAPPTAPRTRTLEELQSTLVGGSRDSFPEGTRIRGDSAYFLHDGSFSWPEACWIAEQHGAHLAIPSATADLRWLTELADGKPFWLGAGKNSRTTWGLLDGTTWKPKKNPSGLGIYLAADKFGFLRAAENRVRLPCMLQWRMDGTNPCTMETILATAGATLRTDRKAYPPGTQFITDRGYCVVGMDTSWDEASRMAQLAGGNLAAISTISEAVYIKDLAVNLHDGQKYWLGGQFLNHQWQWITGEPWTAVAIPAAPASENTYLSISADGRTHATASAQGFLIEWSKDHE